MLSELIAFISSYGYLMLFIGTFLEGETPLILAGFAAYQGYLYFPLVISIAFIGAFLDSQIIFWLGKSKGRSLLFKLNLFKPQIIKLHKAVENYQIPFILFFRFLYGLRTASILAIATSNINSKKFVFFNIIGCFLWAITMGSLGYFFGLTLTAFFIKLHDMESKIFLLIILGAIIFIIERLIRKIILNIKLKKLKSTQNH